LKLARVLRSSSKTVSEPTTTTVYDELGGASGVRRLVDRFYDEMEHRAEVKSLRDQHPVDLTESREKLTWFMSGWLGGPPLYVEKKGHPRLRARHLPFVVDESMRDQWMLCMRVALADVGAVLSTTTREKLDAALFQLAHHMINR
jgi:hemoglobin